MKVIEANEGRKVEYEENGSWLNFDDQISLNLKKMEADHDVHVDITADAFGRLQTGEGVYYVAQLTIPARQYEETEIENPDYVELTEEADIKNLQRTLDLLDDDDDVQAVYTNWDE